MGEFFGSIYCWFEDFFGIDLANYLWGESSFAQTTNMFIGIGLTMLLISLALVVVYYYVVDHPRISNWWGWLIFLGCNAIVNFIVGWQWVLKDYYEGKMVETSKTTGKLVDLPIYSSDILAFGVSNMILAILAFILFSYSIKWWSTNCSNAPF